MDKTEFDNEARSRGFKQHLAEFPRNEMTSYLKVQGIN
jgi:hypothetical protein